MRYTTARPHFIIGFLYCIIYGQPDPRFEPFDWVVYGQNGAITSITEGQVYVYIGTEFNGVLRYNLYGNEFDSPITRAQGLSSNTVQAVHYDHETNILWVATPQALEYSYTGDWEWYHIDLTEYGLPDHTEISRMGSSKDHIWIIAGAMVLKLDRISGILMSMMPSVENVAIDWSSGRLTALDLALDIWTDYSILDGWMLNLDRFIDPYGRSVRATTLYRTRTNDVWIGTEDGTLFTGNSQIEALTPLIFGLASTDIQTITPGRDLWLAGRYGFESEGITRFNPRRMEFFHYDYAITINMNPQSIYSSIDTGNEVWFGGERGILVFQKKDSFWRLIDESRGLISGRILSLAQDSSHVWVGATRGLVRIHKRTKRIDSMGFEERFRERIIYALHMNEGNLWIGTDLGLWVMDLKANRLVDFRTIGDISRIYKDKDIYSHFTRIYESGKKIYFATRQGILSYHLKPGVWESVLVPGEFKGTIITSILIEEPYCFLGSENGFSRVHLATKFRQDYTYPFIGHVNDMYIQGNDLWLATNKGWIQFQWKNDL